MNLVLVEHIDADNSPRVDAPTVDLSSTLNIRLALADLGFDGDGGGAEDRAASSHGEDTLAKGFMMKVMEASTFQELGQIMRKSSDRMGFSHFAVQLELGLNPDERVGALVTDLPQDMVEPEGGMQLFQQLPTFPDNWNNTPLAWSHAANLDLPSQALGSFLASHPQACGLTVPHYGGGRTKGSFHLIRMEDVGQPRKFLTSRVPIATLLSIVMFSAARRLLEQGKLLRTPPALSAREKECLTWAAAGKTAWETAQILGITERTANFHLQNVIRKFGVVNKAQALSVAMASGLI